jgi:hypothetical protein
VSEFRSQEVEKVSAFEFGKAEFTREYGRAERAFTAGASGSGFPLIEYHLSPLYDLGADCSSGVLQEYRSGDAKVFHAADDAVILDCTAALKFFFTSGDVFIRQSPLSDLLKKRVILNESVPRANAKAQAICMN